MGSIPSQTDPGSRSLLPKVWSAAYSGIIENERYERTNRVRPSFIFYRDGVFELLVAFQSDKIVTFTPHGCIL